MLQKKVQPNPHRKSEELKNKEIEFIPVSIEANKNIEELKEAIYQFSNINIDNYQDPKQLSKEMNNIGIEA